MKRADQLRPRAMPASLESAAQALFEEVCCGSRSLWPILGPERMKPGNEVRDQFYVLAHEGMWAAQERFLNLLDSEREILPAELALHRTAMDTIAWQMLQDQLCFARRMYREQTQPSLTNSNLQSVAKTARHLRQEAPRSMPLISDLTTFIQIGDILKMDSGKMSIIEVKEGERNREIGQLADFYRGSQCEEFKENVLQTSDPKTAKQFERMVRQMGRMDFASGVIGKGVGRDPDLEMEVRIPELYIPMEEWDGQLNELFSRALDRGWAIDVIDGALFVGCYVEEKMRAGSPAVFLHWLDKYSGGDKSPVARLIDCISIPLALPIFSLPTTPERMMDILFGRIHVCMGISIPGLVNECQKAGISVRPPNKNERRALQKASGSVVRHHGQPIVLERNGKSMMLADGIFMRTMFHFQRPVTAISALLDNS